MLPLREVCNEFFVIFVTESYEVAFKFALYLGLALDDVFVAAFVFKPRTNFISRLTRLSYTQPVTRRTLARLRGSKHLDYFAGFNYIIERNYSAVYLGTDHLVADRGMNGVCEVNNGSTGREAYNVAARCKNKRIFGDEVAFYSLNYLADIAGLLLILKHLPYPRKALVKV